MDLDNSFEDSFDDEDEAELIALTEKPRDWTQIPTLAQATQRQNFTILDTQQDNAPKNNAKSSQNDNDSKDQPANPNNPPNSDIVKTDLVNLNSKYLQAVGEIAILRARLEEVEKNKTQQIRNAVKTHAEYSKDKEQKINDLQHQVSKLEEEKHFYIAELKNPYLHKDPAANKRRKTGLDNTENLKPSFTSAKAQLKNKPNGGEAPIDEDVEMVPVEKQKQSLDQDKRKLTSIVPKRRQPNYKSLFIESIWSHCIFGSSRKTFDILAKLCITFDYNYGSFKVKKFSDSIASCIMEFLVNTNNEIKISDLISEFLEILVNFCNTLINNDELLAVPFLLALIHNSVTFRSSTASKDILKVVLKFSAELALNYLTLLDSTIDTHDFANTKPIATQTENYLPTRVIENHQIVVIRAFILIFSSDIFEASCKVASYYEDSDYVKEIWMDIVPVNFIRSCLSSSCPINCAVNMIESLCASVTDNFAVNLSSFDKSYDYSKEFCDKELIKLILSLLSHEIEPRPQLFISGLNRSLGNNSKTRLLSEIIPESNILASCSKSPKNLVYAAFPLSLESESTIEEVDLNHKKAHEKHIFYLKSSLISCFENYLTVDGVNKVTYMYSGEFVRNFTDEMRYQQDLIMRNPRSEMMASRVDLISSIILLLAPFFSNDNDVNEDDTSINSRNLNGIVNTNVKRQMSVILTRIAFSSILAPESALEILSEARLNSKYDGFLFNEFCEQKARQLNSLRSIADDNKEQIVQEESAFTNGVEYGFSDGIIGLSRDILECIITPDEADNLYYAFIAEEPESDIV
ncbi:Lcd1 protein [Saccharomycopsis crataegensis]|uniref:Lcd1 protein n=1 Tax=Saccharomycopsis crataegensis TaxID=43959 RepID=A0AAV5QHF9_9ASCO|nr:Lcd1 protein [Saccharomycopsis crataegensis]